VAGLLRALVDPALETGNHVGKKEAADNHAQEDCEDAEGAYCLMAILRVGRRHLQPRIFLLF
jgi:hypothetical protein